MVFETKYARMRLIIIDGPFKGQGFDLETFRGYERVTVGRSGENMFQLPDDSIAEFHCELILGSDRIGVRDRSGCGGTCIDGQPVTEGELLPGKVLQLGGIKFRFEVDEPAPAAREQGLREEIAELVTPMSRWRFSPTWRNRAALGTTAAWAGVFVIFATAMLPYYPHGWRFLLAAVVAGAWLWHPRLGTVLALLGLVLPLACNLPLAIPLLCLVLAFLIPADGFVVLSIMLFLMAHVRWLVPLAPLMAGVLGMGRGWFVGATACLAAELCLLLGGHDPRTGAAAEPLVQLRTAPVDSLADWSWLTAHGTSGSEPYSRIFQGYIDHPQLAAQIILWAVVALGVAWLLRQRSNRYLPANVMAMGGGSAGLLLGGGLVSAFVGSSVMSCVAGPGSIVAAGAVAMLLTPGWTAAVVALNPKKKSSGSGDEALGAKETPKDDWSELAGVDDIRDEIREAVRSHFDPVNRESLRKLSLQPTKGVLFFGPPGTGKTKLARLIAAEAQAAFYAVSGTEFTSKWYGESEANLRRIFETAQQNRPAVLFFDELEAFLPRRGDLSRSDAPEKGILATFLSYTDGVANLDGVFLVGATNHPELIDPAALRPGRFDKVVYVSAPDAASRRSIFERYLASQSLAADVNLDKLASMSERFTGADIQSVCNEAVLESVVRGGGSAVDMAALTSAIGGTKPSVTLEMLRTYEKIADQYGRRSRKAAKVEVVARAELGWDSVAGLEDVKNALREAVEMPLQHVELFQQYGVKPPKGVLMFGPPGCGKTLLAKVIAKVARANFVHVKGPELLRQMTGQSETKLRECFDRARESAPCVLFFDEIDALAGARGTENASGTQILTQFLTEMDGLDELKGVVVVAATNRPDVLDPALLRPGRFDRLLYVPPPDLPARVALFQRELSGKPVASDIDYHRLGELAAGYSSADLSTVCNQTALGAARDTLMMGQRQEITTQRVEDQLKRSPSSLDPEELACYEKLRDKFQR
jgi:transitional endoplasmic reticulum ATPase